MSCAKAAEPVEMPFGLWARMGPWTRMESCIRWVQITSCEDTIFRETNMPWQALRLSAVSCAKMAEPIDLPLELWTWAGRRKHKFNRICQVAPMGGHIGATWQIRLNRPSAAVLRPYVKLL